MATKQTNKHQHGRNFKPAYKKNSYVVGKDSLFDVGRLHDDAKKILDTFDDVVQGVKPLSSKQLHLLPNIIRDLSHSLTDERGERRKGYMNDSQLLSAYTRYFSWWNLVRLTRLFANLPNSSLSLSDGEICLDIGSGPLTVVCALWLARPELRAKKIVWYCMDISKTSLALGEDIYLSIVARTGGEAWQIVRVNGALGTQLKQKASFITCANMFNELYQDTNETPEFSAKKYSEALLSYATDNARVLVVEPGIPKTARFISLLRDSFIRKKMQIISPCPHANECPMNGAHAHRGGTSKWCNFSFNTEELGSVPVALQKLSEASKLGKYRAVLSFVFATRASAADSGVAATSEQNSHLENVSSHSESAISESIFRIASEPIKLPSGDVGFYACNEMGLVLAVNQTDKNFSSGDLVVAKMKGKGDFLIDEKSGAKILVIGK